MNVTKDNILGNIKNIISNVILPKEEESNNSLLLLRPKKRIVSNEFKFMVIKKIEIYGKIEAAAL